MNGRKRLIRPLVPLILQWSAGTEQDYVTIPGTVAGNLNPRAIVGLPIEDYPLRGVNQIIFRWFLKTKPTGAFTKITITPFGARAFQHFIQTGSNVDARFPHYDAPAASADEIYARTFDNLAGVIPAGSVTPGYYAITKTDADRTLTVGTVPVRTLNIGTEHPLPIGEEHFGFLIEQDGDDNTGLQSISVELSWT